MSITVRKVYLPAEDRHRRNGDLVGDAFLKHIAGLKSLTNLVLANTEIADAGLEHLKGIDGLSFLNLANTSVVDAGLEHLKGIDGLSLLNLAGTRSH